MQHYDSSTNKLYPRYDDEPVVFSADTLAEDDRASRKSSLCDIVASTLFFLCLVVFFFGMSGSSLRSGSAPSTLHNATQSNASITDAAVASGTASSTNTAELSSDQKAEPTEFEKPEDEFRYIEIGDNSIYVIDRSDKICAFKSCRTLDPHFDRKTIAKLPEVDEQVKVFLDYDHDRIVRIEEGVETEEDDYNLLSTHGKSHSNYMGKANEEIQHEMEEEEADTLHQKGRHHKTYIPVYDEGVD